MKFYVCMPDNKNNTRRWVEHESLGQAAHDAKSKVNKGGIPRLILQGETADVATVVFEVFSVTEVVFRLVAPVPKPENAA